MPSENIPVTWLEWFFGGTIFIHVQTKKKKKEKETSQEALSESIQ